MTENLMPTRQPGGTHDDYVEEHPAFGTIAAHRVSVSHGGRGGTHLFQSDFDHTGYVTIRISHADVRRGLSNDWVHSGKRITEVAMSEAQWATFVSSLNVGGGVPCTLQWLPGGPVPGIAATTNRRDQFNAEVADTLTEVVDGLKALIDNAPTKRMAEQIRQVLQNVEKNLPFVARQFDEHAEATVEKARIEVNAYVTQMLQRSGLAALQGGGAQAPFSLGTAEVDPTDGRDWYAGDLVGPCANCGTERDDHEVIDNVLYCPRGNR